jgi:1-acyl-sn-glycerol-3-phosphate acyltransferase
MRTGGGTQQAWVGMAPTGGVLSTIAPLYYFVAFYACVLMFALSCLAVSLPSALLHRVLPRRTGERLGRLAIMGGFRWLLWLMRATGVLRVDLSPLDRLRDVPGGLVIAGNHPTALDCTLFQSRLPRTVCITKASLLANPLYGGAARLAGYIRNDAPLPMIRRAAQAVREGGQLLIFPEGSRTAHPPLDAFHRSFAVMAKAAGAPVQTVLIEADSPYLTKGWPIIRRPPLPLVYRVRLGRRFEVGSDPDAFTTMLEGYVRDELTGRGAAP